MALQPRFLTRALTRVESLSELDRPAGMVSSAISTVIRTGPVKDAASGSWLGHPLHPLLVSLPIGAWTSASVLDLAGGKGSASAARKLVGLGLLAAFPTAAAGGSDFTDTEGAERRVGLIHAIGAWTSIACYAASWKARGKPTAGARLKGRAWALIGGGTLAATGYLGGQLSYVYGVGVDTSAFQKGPAEWTPVASADEVSEGSTKQVRVDGVAIVLARHEGTLYALGDRCTHRGGPLSDGEREGDCLVCPWHGSAYQLADGAVARGPASIPQPTYEVRVVDGNVLVRRAETRSLRSNPV